MENKLQLQFGHNLHRPCGHDLLCEYSLYTTNCENYAVFSDMGRSGEVPGTQLHYESK